MAQAVATLLTIGEIARQLGVPIHRVRYLLHTRKVRPIGRAGIANVYDEHDVARLARALRQGGTDR